VASPRRGEVSGTRISPASLLAGLRSLSPPETLALTAWITAITALLVLLIAHLQRILPKSFHYSGTLSTVSAWTLLAALLSGLVMALAQPRRWLSSDTRISIQGIKSYILAMQTGILLLPVPAFLLVWKSPYDNLEWFGYGFLNKRWLFAFYWLATLASLVFPHIFAYLLESRSQSSSVLPAPETSEILEIPQGRKSRKWFWTVSRTLLALCLAWFLAGPPWNLYRHHRPIDFHEQVNLGPLQAIEKGYIPYIGAASTQYGPGSELVTYLFMKLAGRFDVVGFREATACLHLATMLGFCLVAFSLLDIWSGLAVLLLGLAYSPLIFFLWAPDGTLYGFYGWGNGCRYLGVLIVIAGLARLAHSERPHRWVWPSFVLGLIWGLFSWLSQENLSSTALGAGLLMTLLWLTDTTKPRTIVHISLSLLCGLVGFWAPILSYYSWHGVVRDFVHWYFLVPSMVVRGFSNTFWPPTDTLQAKAFYFTGPFLILAGICTIGDFRRLRPRKHLNRSQVCLLGFLCSLAASYPSSLFRSDSSHLINTLIALPFVIFLACRHVPDWVFKTLPVRWVWRIAMIALVFYLYPLSPFFHDIYNRTVLSPLSKFAKPQSAQARPVDYRIPFQRATRYLSDEPYAAASLGDIPMRTFLEYMEGLRELIGNRRTYIQGFPGTAASFPYFMMDLTPAPHLVDQDMLMINSAVRDEAVAYFTEHVRECDAVITADLASQEAQVFLRAYPNAVGVKRSLGRNTVYVLLSGTSQGR